MTPLVSFIIAAKDPEPSLFQRLSASILALRRSSELEVILVLSGGFEYDFAPLSNGLARFDLVRVPARGVYDAYNHGIDSSSGEFCIFYGIDDIVLPPMNDALDYLAAQYQVDLLACGVYMESIGINMPRLPLARILLKNWCHQGIFYRRSLLVREPYSLKYPVQDDHYSNIRFASSPACRVHLSEFVVAFFSGGGVSSIQSDLNFRADLPQLALKSFGLFWYAVVRLKQLGANLWHGSAESRRTRA